MKHTKKASTKECAHEERYPVATYTDDLLEETWAELKCPACGKHFLIFGSLTKIEG